MLSCKIGLLHCNVVAEDTSLVSYCHWVNLLSAYCCNAELSPQRKARSTALDFLSLSHTHTHIHTHTLTHTHTHIALFRFNNTRWYKMQCFRASIWQTTNNCDKIIETLTAVQMRCLWLVYLWFCDFTLFLNNFASQLISFNRSLFLLNVKRKNGDNYIPENTEITVSKFNKTV